MARAGRAPRAVRAKSDQDQADQFQERRGFRSLPWECWTSLNSRAAATARAAGRPRRSPTARPPRRWPQR